MIGLSRNYARPQLAGSLALIAILAAAPVLAATCNLTAQPLSFGSYDFQDTQDLESVGNIAVTCDVGTSFTIALSPGSGTFATRVMHNGAHPLDYNLYTDTTHTTVWGDGTGGSATVDGSTLINGTETNANRSVYGRIPAGQNPYVGVYTDSITVTLSF